MELDALSCDAIVDVGMCLSEYGYAGEASRTRTLIPANSQIQVVSKMVKWQRQLSRMVMEHAVYIAFGDP